MKRTENNNNHKSFNIKIFKIQSQHNNKQTSQVLMADRGQMMSVARGPQLMVRPVESPYSITNHTDHVIHSISHLVVYCLNWQYTVCKSASHEYTS